MKQTRIKYLHPGNKEEGATDTNGKLNRFSLSGALAADTVVFSEELPFSFINLLQLCRHYLTALQSVTYKL